MAQSYMSYTVRDGKLRIYDGTPSTPFYLELGFVQPGLKGATGKAVPDQKLVMDRGRIGGNFHYQEGTDEKVMAPQTLSFSFMLTNTDPNWKKWRQALNLDMAATWTVGSNTWVTTKGTSQVLSGGETPALVTTPQFVGPRRRTVDIYQLWNDPTVGGGTGDIGVHWAEVEFEPDKQTYDEQNDMVPISCSGLVYGSISQLTAWPSGGVAG